MQQFDTTQLPTLTPVLKRSSRPYIPKKRCMNYMLLTNGGDLECYDEAC